MRSYIGSTELRVDPRQHIDGKWMSTKWRWWNTLINGNHIIKRFLDFPEIILWLEGNLNIQILHVDILRLWHWLWSFKIQYLVWIHDFFEQSSIHRMPYSQRYISYFKLINNHKVLNDYLLYCIFFLQIFWHNFPFSISKIPIWIEHTDLQFNHCQPTSGIFEKWRTFVSSLHEDPEENWILSQTRSIF